MLKVEFHDSAMRKFTSRMPAATNRAVARSLNKALGMTKTQAARTISARRNIKVGTASKEMREVKASPGRPIAMIIARGSPIPLMDVLGTKRVTKKGVTAKVQAKGRPRLFVGAFIQKMKSGHVGVFVRLKPSTHVSKSASKGTKRKNLPIVQITLPSVASTMVQKEVESRLQAFAAPIYEKELLRLIDLEISRSGGR